MERLLVDGDTDAADHRRPWRNGPRPGVNSAVPRSRPRSPRSRDQARSSPSAELPRARGRGGRGAADEPVLFTKFTSVLIGDGHEIRWRAADTRQVDYEAELAVVIGRTARDVTARARPRARPGLHLLNDVSARDLQFGDGQWVRGKSLDTFCPMGPWIVTRDELAGPGRPGDPLPVNGELRQDASTADMIHGVAALIAFCSRLSPSSRVTSSRPARLAAWACSACHRCSSPMGMSWWSRSRGSARWRTAAGWTPVDDEAR